MLPLLSLSIARDICTMCTLAKRLTLRGEGVGSGEDSLVGSHQTRECGGGGRGEGWGRRPGWQREGRGMGEEAGEAEGGESVGEEAGEAEGGGRDTHFKTSCASFA